MRLSQAIPPTLSSMDSSFYYQPIYSGPAVKTLATHLFKMTKRCCQFNDFRSKDKEKAMFQINPSLSQPTFKQRKELQTL